MHQTLFAEALILQVRNYNKLKAVHGNKRLQLSMDMTLLRIKMCYKAAYRSRPMYVRTKSFLRLSYITAYVTICSCTNDVSASLIAQVSI